MHDICCCATAKRMRRHIGSSDIGYFHGHDHVGIPSWNVCNNVYVLQLIVGSSTTSTDLGRL